VRTNERAYKRTNERNNERAE